MRGLVELTPTYAGGEEDCLVLNVTAGEGGRVRAQLLDGEGKPIPGFTFDDCEPLRGDHLAAAVRWKGGRPPSSRRPPASAQIEMEEATLYGFAFMMRP